MLGPATYNLPPSTTLISLSLRPTLAPLVLGIPKLNIQIKKYLAGAGFETPTLWQAALYLVCVTQDQ